MVHSKIILYLLQHGCTLWRAGFQQLQPAPRDLGGAAASPAQRAQEAAQRWRPAPGCFHKLGDPLYGVESASKDIRAILGMT